MLSRLRSVVRCASVLHVPRILDGFATQFGNGSRTYLKAFWERKTRFPMPGHMHSKQCFGQHGRKLRVIFFLALIVLDPFLGNDRILDPFLKLNLISGLDPFLGFFDKDPILFFLFWQKSDPFFPFLIKIDNKFG